MPDRRDHPFRYVHELFGAVSQRQTPARSSSGVLAWAPVASDQGQEPSCVGEASSNAITTVIASLGTVPPPRISAPFAWYVARALDGMGTARVGSRPFQAYAGMKFFGYCALDEWPRTMPYDRRPDGLAFQSAVDQHDLEVYRIGMDGAARGEAIRYSLDVERYPVTHSIQVDPPYSNSDGEWSPTTGTVEGHYVMATHYDETGLWHLNSYGTNWGLRGLCRVPWNIIESDRYTGDLYVATFARAPGTAPRLARPR